MATANIQYRRPGVYAQEVLVTQQPSTSSGNQFVSVLLGTNERGPTTPTFVASWTQYVQLFGAFGTSNSQLPIDVFFYFANGGSGCYVQRVTGASATKASRTLTDGAGTPVATLQVNALNEGVWGNSIYVQVTRKAVTPYDGRFSIVVYYGGTDSASVVERWDDLSMTNSDARYAPAIVNTQTGGNQGSNYINLTDLASSTTAPQDAPATSAVGALAGGANGSTPGSTDWDTAFADDGLLNQIIDQPLQVHISGNYTTSEYLILNKALSWAANRGDAWVVSETASGRNPSQAITDAAQLNSASPYGGYGAVYYPWILVADPSATAPGVTRYIPPGPCMLGLAERTDHSRGVWKAPAGLNAKVLGAVGLERRLSSLELDNLNTAVPAVNALRAIPGAGICVMGARTLTTGSADKYIPNRRSLIYLKSALKDLTQFAVFEPNDTSLWTQLENVCTRFLTGYWQSGGLAGLKPNDAFFVTCDETLNTYAVTQAGEVRIEIGVALNNPAEFVVIRIGQTVAGASTSES